MIAELVERAEQKALKLAPFIGVGCPGIIKPDGFIERGAQNLPGDWESSRFAHIAQRPWSRWCRRSPVTIQSC